MCKIAIVLYLYPWHCFEEKKKGMIRKMCEKDVEKEKSVYKRCANSDGVDPSG